MLCSVPRSKQVSPSDVYTAEYDKAAIDGEPCPERDMTGFGIPIEKNRRNGRPPCRPAWSGGQQREEPHEIPGIMGRGEEHCRGAQCRRPGQARTWIRRPAQSADRQPCHDGHCQGKIRGERHGNGTPGDVEEPKAAPRG